MDAAAMGDQMAEEPLSVRSHEVLQIAVAWTVSRAICVIVLVALLAIPLRVFMEILFVEVMNPTDQTISAPIRWAMTLVAVGITHCCVISVMGGPFGYDVCESRHRKSAGVSTNLEVGAVSKPGAASRRSV